MLEKKDLRKKYKILRKQFSEDVINRLSEQIATNFVKNINYKNKHISIFLPIDSQLEINTFKLMKAIENESKVYAPISNFEDYSMKHLQITSDSKLNINNYGIPEPIEGKQIDDSLFDIVITPLLTINEKGYRIGYGKGFYDRFLKKCSSNCLFIGINLFDNLEKFNDYSENDIPLHVCITPNNVHYFER